MPRVHHVKKARKDNSAVKKGEPYFWWKFRNGGKCYSATRPRESQLTSGKKSEFYGVWEGLEDSLTAADDDFDRDEMKALVDEAADELQRIGEEYQESFDNMPDGLQGGSTGEAIQSAAEGLQEACDELGNVDYDEDTDIEDILESVFSAFENVCFEF